MRTQVKFLPLLALAISTVFPSITFCQSPLLQKDRVIDSLRPGPSVTLPGHIPAFVRNAPDLGPLSPATNLQLTFVIARDPAVQAAFTQLVDDQQTPGSAQFHHWLTPEQIGAQYGPTQHDLDALTGWLTASGYHIDNVTPSRIMVQATAPVQIVESTLHTTLHRFTLVSGIYTDTVHAPLSEPLLPASLAPIVQGIVGLSEIPNHIHSTRRQIAAPAASSPDLNNGPGENFLTPNDFAVIYDLNPAYQAGTTGTGQKIMIIGGARLYATDLTNFESFVNLPSYQPNYTVPSGFTDPGPADSTGSQGTSQDDNQGEGTLDFERAYGTAPGATIDQVIAQNWLSGTVTFNLLTAAINTVNDPVMNMSFGSCEVHNSAAALASLNTLYQQAAGQGIGIFVSSGDAGVDGCESQGQPAVANQVASINALCASPYVTCVGGTEFNDTPNATYWSSNNGSGYESALGYIPEGAWNEPTSTNNSGQTVYQVLATGGGPSTTQAKPSWQSAPGVPADGARDTPDISFSASLHNGYFSCLALAGENCTSRFTVFAGTSASAPSMAGIAALYNQKAGARQGNLNKTLYSLATTDAAVFHDATVASSGVTNCSTATPSICNNSDPSTNALTGGIAGYELTAGYDLDTGLGSLDVSKFLTAASLPLPSANLAASPATITVSQTAAFTVTLTAPTGSSAIPTGTIQFASNGTDLGAPVTLSGGVATSPAESFSLAATYSITAIYSGDSNYSPATFGPLSFVVTNPSAVPSTSVLTASATSVTTVQTVTFTDTVAGASGTPAGNVQFLVDGTNQGAAVALNAGVAATGPLSLAAGPHTVTAVYAGNATYSASTSNAISVTVTALPSSTSINVSPTTITPTGTTTIGGTVTGVSGDPAPTGTITLNYATVNNGSGTFGTLSLNNGSVSGTLSGTVSNPLPVDTYTLQFVYSGDANYASSTSPTATLVVSSTVALAASTSTLTINPSTIATNSTGTITFTVSGSSGTPTGSVALSSGAFSLGTYTLTNGSASATLSPASLGLGVGTYSVSGVYSGSSVYSPSTSNTVVVTITAASAGTVALSPASPTLSITPGASTSDNITVTTTNLNGSETLACSVAFAGSGTANDAPTCSITQPTLPATGTATATLSLSTTAAQAVRRAGGLAVSRSLGLAGIAFCGLLALCFPRRNRKMTRGIRNLAALVFLAATFAALSGCGGGSSTPVTNPGTTPGSYTITINASGAAAASTTVTLTVQ